MTPQEALAGFQTLNAKFPSKRYRGAELNAVWTQLLSCRREAFERAVGILLKHSRYLPKADYVLEQTRQWEQRMQAGLADPEPGPVELTREMDHGKEAVRLIRLKMAGEIPVQEFIDRMYRMSEFYGAVEYARVAQMAERRLGQGGDEE